MRPKIGTKACDHMNVFVSCFDDAGRHAVQTAGRASEEKQLESALKNINSVLLYIFSVQDVCFISVKI
jgi:predicted 3-demethylubiquinone-9 3-methyltransferase (glyoxalase superfamily)